MLANGLVVLDTGLLTPPDGLRLALFSLLLTIWLDEEAVEGPATLLVRVVLLTAWL